MIALEHVLVSEDLLEKKFVCHLEECRGACCVRGDNGAPLEEADAREIAKNLKNIKPFMEPGGLALLREKGFSETDARGDIVTTCRPTGECLFVRYDPEGTAQCAIETANTAGRSTFIKPISCHLYPGRAKKIGEYIALNYDRWKICDPACALGNKRQVPLFIFLKEALIRKFGPEWFAGMETVSHEWKKVH